MVSSASGLVAGGEENFFQTLVDMRRCTSAMLRPIGRLGRNVLMKSSNETSVLLWVPCIRALRCSASRVLVRNDDVTRCALGVSGLGGTVADVDMSLSGSGGGQDNVSKGWLVK